MLDDAYLWSTDGNAAATVLDGDNEVLETTGALICSDCQVKHKREQARAWVASKLLPAS